MFSIPGNVGARAHHMFQRAANDRTGVAKALLQAELYVGLARVDLNGLACQR